MTAKLQKFIDHAPGDVPLVCLTAYTAPMAKSLAPYVDLLLVGDSVGTVLYGMENTTGVTLDMMIAHGRAVMRSAPNAPVIIDMPYGTYEESAAVALTNARHIIEEIGADGVKLEGGHDMRMQISAITGAGIPVMGHIGLQPQSVEKEGGYKIKGKTEEQIQNLIHDAKAIEEAGVFAFVLEGTIASAAHEISTATNVPCIGIGASEQCDGQILVSEDMLGLHHGHRPKFVHEYSVLRDNIATAARSYAQDVRSRAFPRDENLYQGQKQLIQKQKIAS